MSLIDKIKETPNLIKRVDINFHHLNDAAVTKDSLKNKIINQLASYMVKQGLIGYEEKNEDGVTKIHATCYAIDIDKLKNNNQSTDPT